MVIEFRARPNYVMRIRRVELQDLTTSDFQGSSVEQDEEVCSYYCLSGPTICSAFHVGDA
jgi:hypothetical protein